MFTDLGSITFFAVPNSGLPKPHKPGRHHNRNTDVDGGRCHNHSDLDLLVLEVEQLDHFPSSVDKERRRRCLARIVRGVLAYHILPDKYSSIQLLENSTYATNLTLKDGSMDYQPLRVSVQRTALPPGIRINAFVSVTKRNIEAKNGLFLSMPHELCFMLFCYKVLSTTSTDPFCLLPPFSKKPSYSRRRSPTS